MTPEQRDEAIKAGMDALAEFVDAPPSALYDNAAAVVDNAAAVVDAAAAQLLGDHEECDARLAEANVELARLNKAGQALTALLPPEVYADAIRAHQGIVWLEDRPAKPAGSTDCPTCGHAVDALCQPVGCLQLVDDHQVCDEQLVDAYAVLRRIRAGWLPHRLSSGGWWWGRPVRDEGYRLWSEGTVPSMSVVEPMAPTEVAAWQASLHPKAPEAATTSEGG
jgi:hypothetical protein